MVLEASIGRYRLDELIRRGGSSEVWKAYDEVLRRPVALKLLISEVGKAIDRPRFAREAQAAARLSHPHIVATYDVGEWEERPYLVMEYLDGRTVADDLKQHGRLPIEQVRAIGVQVTDALAHAHAAGVVHRDVKPDNLVWTEDGVLKLVDFGVSWLLDETGPRLTSNGMAMGTFAYLAPEIAKGEPFDERSDLYSLGCVLYELLCGVPPFVGPMPMVVLAHVQSEPIPPGGLRDDIPPNLERLVLELLAKEPGDRPAGAATTRARLLDAGKEDRARQFVAPMPRTIRGRRKGRALAVAAGVLAAATAGAAIWWAVPGGDGGPVAEVGPFPVSTPTSDTGQERDEGADDADSTPKESRADTDTAEPRDDAKTGEKGGQVSLEETEGGVGSPEQAEAGSDLGGDGPGGRSGRLSGTGDGALEQGGDGRPPIPVIAEEASNGAATKGRANGHGNGRGPGHGHGNGKGPG